MHQKTKSNKTNIHPLIDKMNISDNVKYYFNKLKFDEIIKDDIVLSNPAKEVNECLQNRWSFAVDFKYCNMNDLLVLYQSIIDSRRDYLIQNKIEIKMIFYTWYDSMSGNLNFSLIPQNWSKLLPDQELPFGCAVNKVNKLADIILNFINDPYKGAIPIDEFKVGDLQDDDDDDQTEHILDVWSIIL